MSGTAVAEVQERSRTLPRHLRQQLCRVDERCPGRAQTGLLRPFPAPPDESVSYLSCSGSRLVHEPASPPPREPPNGAGGRLRQRSRAKAPASSATETTSAAYGNLRLPADERDRLLPEFRLLGRRYPVRPGKPDRELLGNQCSWFGGERHEFTTGLI